jgi:hypothetical protein
MKFVKITDMFGVSQVLGKLKSTDELEIPQDLVLQKWL